MITINDVSLHSSDRRLFDGVNIKFTPGNCYGLIGANGAGRSTFLKVLSGDLQPSTGPVTMGLDERMAVLEQDYYDYEGCTVLETVIMGHKRLYEVMEEKDAIYMKEDFTDEDDIQTTELEGEFAKLNGWEAKPEVAVLLQGLNIPEELHHQQMSELVGGQKIKVLLVQILFGKPDVLLLDEPTNGLSIQSVNWLEKFLINFENTVAVVSYDRHFLNKICTHMTDLDFDKIKLYVGNYDFWLESSQSAAKLQANANVKEKEQIKKLQEFIARLSADVSKSKQATLREKMLEKITLDDIQPFSRRYPFVGFRPKREIGNDSLQVENVSVAIDGKRILDDILFNLSKEDKVTSVAENDITATTLFKVIMGGITPDTGAVRWGVTTNHSCLPEDTTKKFDTDLTTLDWLYQHANKEEDDNIFLRSFLGRMLSSGEEVLKPVNVLSDGEKARYMLSKMMLSKANVLVSDDPTNRLDLESITMLNDGLIALIGSILSVSHNHQSIQTLTNHIIATSDKDVVDRADTTYDKFLEDTDIQKQLNGLWA